jgi:hypothetical protein
MDNSTSSGDSHERHSSLRESPDNDVLDSEKMYSNRVHVQTTAKFNITKQDVLDIVKAVFDRIDGVMRRVP